MHDRTNNPAVCTHNYMLFASVPVFTSRLYINIKINIKKIITIANDLFLNTVSYNDVNKQFSVGRHAICRYILHILVTAAGREIRGIDH